MESATAAVMAARSLSSSSDGCGVRSRDMAVRRRRGIVSFDSASRFSGSGLLKNHEQLSFLKEGKVCQDFRRRTKSTAVQASMSPSGSVEYSFSVAPLRPESPVGQFLLQILTSHPHLLQAAVESQLQQMETERTAEREKDESTMPSSDILLYRRIAEVKANDRSKALEEILYALIVKKFMDADVFLVPAISQPSNSSGKADNWPNEEEKLVKLHSLEANEMIRNHLQVILGPRLKDCNVVAPISKLRIRQVYTASVTYGYFLKRVDQRFQLEKNMKTLRWGSHEEEFAFKEAMSVDSRPNNSASPCTATSSSSIFADDRSINSSSGVKSSPLRAYVSSFDSDIVRRYAKLRSKEALNMIENHTEALFGKPVIVITPSTLDSSKDELVNISFAGLRSLILEAVTFGSFLWEVEDYVDSQNHFLSH